MRYSHFLCSWCGFATRSCPGFSRFPLTRGGVALWPAPCAMEGRVVSAHGYHQMGPYEILRLSTQRESIERSRDRCKPCPEAAKRLLRELGESRAFWFALRRHGTSELCLRWLQKMTEHSSWATDRHSENEILRKEYLRFWQEVRDYRPNFQDEEMKRRQRDAGTVQAAESAS